MLVVPRVATPANELAGVFIQEAIPQPRVFAGAGVTAAMGALLGGE